MTPVEMLTAVVRFADAHEDDDRPLVSGDSARAFRRMLEELESGERRALSPKQIAWVQDVHERIGGAPSYRNDWSAGRVPRGREVATPDVLRNLPKAPPRKREIGQ